VCEQWCSLKETMINHHHYHHVGCVAGRAAGRAKNAPPVQIAWGWPKLWAEFRALTGKIPARTLGRAAQFGPCDPVEIFFPRNIGLPRRKEEIGGSGGSLVTPGPLLTHLHTVYMAYSGCLPTHLNPLADRTCFSQVTHLLARGSPPARQPLGRRGRAQDLVQGEFIVVAQRQPHPCLGLTPTVTHRHFGVQLQRCISDLRTCSAPFL
jgi:hypothetical protein